VSTTSQNPSVSVILVCHNDGKWLPRCLESVKAQTIFNQLELIVADNASQDGTDRIARNLILGWAGASFLPTGGDWGFGVACNRAAEIARGRYLYFLNPDTWMEPDCLEQLYKAAEREKAGAAGGTVLEYDDQSVQADGGTGFDFSGNYTIATGKHRQAFLMCPSCFIFVRRDLFFKVGTFDEKFFLYGEEMDLSWRIWVAGENVVSVPLARIHHRGAVGVNPEGGTRVTENRTSVQKRFLANRNRLLMIAKSQQHLLLLMLVPCAALIVLEGVGTWIMTRNWSLAKATCFDALTNFWRLRAHIRHERQRIAVFRRRGDLWMLRFFRFRFGRWEEVKRILKAGFPRIN
jgi:GT2 family glycosyltransferase